jgi:hypothetical protein
MREDMSRVIVERPRLGGGRTRKAALASPSQVRNGSRHHSPTCALRDSQVCACRSRPFGFVVFPTLNSGPLFKM